MKNPNDTPLDQIKYGCDIYPIVAGRRVRRHFKPIKCRHCGEMLRVRLIEHGPRAGYLYKNQDHNRRQFCDDECRRNHQTKKAPPPAPRVRVMEDDRTTGHPWLYRPCA